MDTRGISSHERLSASEQIPSLETTRINTEGQWKARRELISRCGEKSMEVVAALPVKTDAHSQSTWFFFTHIATAVCRRNE